MRTADRTAAALVVLIGALAARADVSSAQVTPPGSPTDGPVVDLHRLSDPVALEQRLRSLLKTNPAGRITVPDGQARRGNVSVAASETLTGNLLVMEGRLDLHGTVTGNVVALDGDIVLYPGALVTGDALAIGGRI